MRKVEIFPRARALLSERRFLLYFKGLTQRDRTTDNRNLKFTVADVVSHYACFTCRVINKTRDTRDNEKRVYEREEIKYEYRNPRRASHANTPS